ncbi:MAG: lipid-A-disaccharide synthase [Verrucomicrobiales bacterium]|nr:lipid-A-disaccharide synthase [Verrucomicrobiales bacterium]
MKTLFAVAGEISGDTHGAALLRSLREAGDWSFSGLGGPLMNAESDSIENWLDDAAVLGLWEVLKKYGYFRAKMEETATKILSEKPDGLVLIDYPGFNLRLAERLRKEGYSGRIIYYISPQVWAWKKGRIRKMAELLDRMICIFPFEKELYESSGLPTDFAGHPLVDEMEEIRDPSIEREENFVALLPGSREREIAKLFPPMLDAAEKLRAFRPELRFGTTGATAELTARLREETKQRGLEGVFEIGEQTSHEIMQRAGVGVVASGTATLEAACLGLPYCLTYKVAWLTATVARWLMSVKFLGIVNVMAGREVVRELLQDDARGEAIAGELRRLLENPDEREELKSELDEVVESLGEGGSHRRAAESVAAAFS